MKQDLLKGSGLRKTHARSLILECLQSKEYALSHKDLEEALSSTSEVNLKEAQIKAWSSVLVHIRDHQKKREIINKIDNLKTEISVLQQTSEQSREVYN